MISLLSILTALSYSQSVFAEIGSMAKEGYSCSIPSTYDYPAVSDAVNFSVDQEGMTGVTIRHDEIQEEIDRMVAFKPCTEAISVARVNLYKEGRANLTLLCSVRNGGKSYLQLDLVCRSNGKTN